MDLLLHFGAQPLLLAAARRIIAGNFAFQQVRAALFKPQSMSSALIKSQE